MSGIGLHHVMHLFMYPYNILDFLGVYNKVIINPSHIFTMFEAYDKQLIN